MIGMVVTTKNEQWSIGRLVTEGRHHGWRVVVVDENSRDRTAKRAWEAGAEIIEMPDGSGIGECLMAGWKRLEQCEKVIQLDAGDSHYPYQALPMLQRDVDIIIGSRFLDGSRYLGNPTRRRLSAVASWMCRLKSGIPVTDWTSGFRVFSRRAISTLLYFPYSGRMHDWQIEVLRYAFSSGLTVQEMPITYLGGRSSFNTSVALAAFAQWRRL